MGTRGPWSNLGIEFWTPLFLSPVQIWKLVSSTPGLLFATSVSMGQGEPLPHGGLSQRDLVRRRDFTAPVTGLKVSLYFGKPYLWDPAGQFSCTLPATDGVCM